MATQLPPCRSDLAVQVKLFTLPFLNTWCLKETICIPPTTLDENTFPMAPYCAFKSEWGWEARQVQKYLAKLNFGSVLLNFLLIKQLKLYGRKNTFMQIYFPQRDVQCILTSRRIHLLLKNSHPVILYKPYFIEIMFTCCITEQRTTLPKGREKKTQKPKNSKV